MGKDKYTTAVTDGFVGLGKLIAVRVTVVCEGSIHSDMGVTHCVAIDVVSMCGTDAVDV